MSESFQEQLDRVELMAAGNPTWDLSGNDIAALQAVLKDRRKLLTIAKGEDAVIATLRLERDRATEEMRRHWVANGELEKVIATLRAERDEFKVQAHQFRADVIELQRKLRGQPDTPREAP